MRRELHKKSSGTHKRRAAAFTSLEKANEWLREQNSIFILDMHIGVSYVSASLVRRIVLGLIRFDYLLCSDESDNRYSLDEYDSLSVSNSVDPDAFRKVWHRENADRECVRCIKKTSKRTIMGKGNERLTLYRDKFVVLHKNKRVPQCDTGCEYCRYIG